jgi:hypothetical protein
MRRTALLIGLMLAALGIGATASADPPLFSHSRQIDNPYLPLSKYERCELRGREDGARSRVVRRLLDRSKAFRVGAQTVRAAVIEDRAFEDGELVERTLDYFAQGDSGIVYYLGEDVDNYENGKVVDHEGSWLYGPDTSTLGVAMPAHPRVGSSWRFEDVPGITTESDRVVDRLARVPVRGKIYRHVIRVREHSTPDEVEHKLYARGVGVIRERPPDGRVDLVGCRA